ncbi:hypothetical protein D6D08_00985 [Aureobasidium pullulans]|nr:hypothetical protein D6D08_00985 [Aureobasidium pullulans]
MHALGHWEHLYCRACERYFNRAGDLDQHMNSPIHTRADPIQRPAAPFSPPITRPVPPPSVARPAPAPPLPPVVTINPVPRPQPVVNRTSTTSIAKPPPRSQHPIKADQGRQYTLNVQNYVSADRTYTGNPERDAAAHYLSVLQSWL